ncbi:DUF2063 domain-containing protein [Pseudomonas sp. Q12-87]|uniref:HvfC family RiPP maturation protein n=1 Tax=Pseudomonas sp. Q12-87 TaxID=177989 RepID=UPI00069D9E32|nr:putative DNA-binding domain-containing protein [Pseudomonas sp. Q12-87]
MSARLLEQLSCMANYVRDPRNPGPPGLQARRLAVYRQLFLGNIESLLAGSFPVIRRTLATADWQRLVNDFYAGHRSQTPLFTQIAGEFVGHLEQRTDSHGYPAWLAELAHHEWSESALLLSDAKDPAHDPNGDLIQGIPVVSALAWTRAYLWPVCDIGPGHQPAEPSSAPTLLLLRRRGDQVTFSRLAPLAYTLLVSLTEHRRSGHEHLIALAETVGVPPQELLPVGVAALNDFRVQGIVLGTRMD